MTRPLTVLLRRHYVESVLRCERESERKRKGEREREREREREGERVRAKERKSERESDSVIAGQDQSHINNSHSSLHGIQHSALNIQCEIFQESI